MSAATSLPDILGYVTGNVRYNTSMAQVALAVRPRVVRTGRPFEVLALIQNVTDGQLDLKVMLQISPQDARRFIAKTDRFNLILRPAEVGYVTLPVNCALNTAAGDSYKLGVAFEVKALDKANRLRPSKSSDNLKLDDLSESRLEQLGELKKLSFSATRRGLMGTVLEVPFSILSGQNAAETEVKANWMSLWKLSDHRDERLLLRQYAGILQNKILPQLKRNPLYPALYRTTTERFRAAGYELHSAEAHYITKLLIVILEMAAPEEQTYDHLGLESYNITLTLKRINDQPAIQLPRWCRAMLRQIEEQPALAERPIALLAGAVYDELIRDAMQHSFHMISRVTGESLGSEEDTHHYTESWIKKLQTGNPPLTFADVYLPLAIGGAIVFERAITADEKVGECLSALSSAVKSRFNEVTDDHELVYHMAEQVVDRALQKYGYRV